METAASAEVTPTTHTWLCQCGLSDPHLKEKIEQTGTGEHTRAGFVCTI